MSQTILVLIDGRETLLDMKDFFQSMKIDSHIRIHDSEYQDIDSSKIFFVHFNLGSTSHKVGCRYALARILRAGYERDGEVVLPLLSYDNIYFGECVEVGNNIDYLLLDSSIFEYSMVSIDNTSSLKDTILRRYRTSRPELSDAEILSKGVGYTKLRFIQLPFSR